MGLDASPKTQWPCVWSWAEFLYGHARELAARERALLKSEPSGNSSRPHYIRGLFTCSPYVLQEEENENGAVQKHLSNLKLESGILSLAW